MLLRQELGFADDDVVIGYVANFARGKGPRPVDQCI